MNEAQITLEKPAAHRHIPASHEVESEKIRREVEARRHRDQKEQEEAEVIRKLILHVLD
ncbi:MAG TPA: hypothetical protein VFW52_03775 [Candidatus Saccharimonadales bacterium]|nr:hypothetical protein [Candidatus Saccharimonadales bacterium]